MAKNSKLLTTQEAKAIDIKAKKVFGISTLVLMENAGRQVAEEAFRVIKKKEKSKIAIFCGKGNNGGDGLVAARHLLAKGIKPEIFLAGKLQEVRSEAKTNLKILLRLKQNIIELNKANLHLVKNKISKYVLVIDALLGVGLAGEVRGVFKDLIKIINLSQAYVLAIDIPSGLDATTGEVLGCCVRADKTLTFIAKKRGMILGKGPKYCGQVIVRDLGIPV